MEALGLMTVDLNSSYCLVLERLEGTAVKEFGQINNSQRVPKIRLIGAELQHGLFITDNRIRCLCNLEALRCEFFKGGCQNLLTYPEYILLGDLSALASSSRKQGAIWKYLSIPDTIRSCLYCWGA